MVTAADVALLILRLVLGLTLAAHGFNKFFGGGRIPGTAGLAAGLLTPIAAAGFVALMSVAVWTVHRANGFFVLNEGWEYNLVLATGAVVVAMLGPGRLSLDHQIFCRCWLNGWTGLLIAVGLGLAGAIGQLLLFYRSPTVTGE